MVMTEFRALDLDGNGFITVDELRAACQKAGLSELSNEQLQNELAELDDGKNGMVDFSEYMRHRRSLKFPKLIWASAASAAVATPAGGSTAGHNPSPPRAAPGCFARFLDFFAPNGAFSAGAEGRGLRIPYKSIQTGVRYSITVGSEEMEVCWEGEGRRLPPVESLPIFSPVRISRVEKKRYGVVQLANGITFDNPERVEEDTGPSALETMGENMKGMDDC